MDSCFRESGPTEARRVCVERGAHRPDGEPVQHHELMAVRCADCGSLVVDQRERF